MPQGLRAVGEDRIFKLTEEFDKVPDDSEASSTETLGCEVMAQERAEGEVEVLRERIEFILCAAKTGLEIIDSEFNIRYMDPERQKLYGEPIGKKCYKCFMGRKSACTGCGVVKALEIKNIVVTEAVLVNENNRAVQVTTIPFKHEDGEWLAAQVKVDIAERKQAEKEARQSQEALQTILDSIPFGIIVVGRDKVIRRANKAAMTMAGYDSYNQIVGHVCHKILCPAEESKCPIIDLQQQIDMSERAVISKDKREIPVMKSVIPITLEGEEVLLETFIDMRRRKETEESLERSYASQKILNNLLSISMADIPLENMLGHFIEEIISVPWLSVEPKGAILLVEEQPEVLVMKAQKGLSPELVDMCSQVPFNRCICGRTAASGKVQFVRRLDGRHENKIAEMEPHGHCCVPIKLTSKEVAGVINLYVKENQVLGNQEQDFLSGIADVLAGAIERKRAEEELKNLNAELGETIDKLTLANRELGDFAHITAHDLKAPLRAIGSLAGMISLHYGENLDERGKELLDLLVQRTERMSEQISSILRYSELGHIREKKGSVNLNVLVKDVISDIAPPKKIKIRIEGTLPTVMCEKTPVFQVFQNLLDNAIKYIDKPKGQIVIGCMEDNDFWRFNVTDNGRGIKEKYFEKVFKIFQTLSPRDEAGTTGIGLSVVKKIVELHGGSVWIESEPGKGSTFFFTLAKQESEIVNNATLQTDTAG